MFLFFFFEVFFLLLSCCKIHDIIFIIALLIAGKYWREKRNSLDGISFIEVEKVWSYRHRRVADVGTARQSSKQALSEQSGITIFRIEFFSNRKCVSLSVHTDCVYECESVHDILDVENVAYFQLQWAQNTHVCLMGSRAMRRRKEVAIRW